MVPFNNVRINSGMVIIRVNPKIINEEYLYKYFNSIQLQKNIAKVSFGSAQPQLTVKEINRFNLAFPSIEEQKKIASFLTDVDDKITKFNKNKSLLEQYKKGVMQKIFNQELRFKDDEGKDFSDWEEKKLGRFVNLLKGYKFLNRNK